MANTLLIRADASPLIGLGHAARCLALALEWRRTGGTVRWLASELPPAISERLQRNGVELTITGVDPGSFADMQQLSGKQNGGWTVLDSYAFDTQFQKHAAANGRVLIIDDNGWLAPYHANVIVNQNVAAKPELYESATNADLLLGTEYALLRPEFQKWHRKRDPRPDVERILVLLGGGASSAAIGFVQRAFALVKFAGDVKLVIGPVAESRGVIRGMDPVSAPEDMSELMAWADVAISAAGSSMWELSYMQVPFTLVTVAENQKESAAWMVEHGYAAGSVDISGRPEDLARNINVLLEDAALREGAALAGRRLVDGLGARRVVEHLKSHE